MSRGVSSGGGRSSLGYLFGQPELHEINGTAAAATAINGTFQGMKKKLNGYKPGCSDRPLEELDDNSEDTKAFTVMLPGFEADHHMCNGIHEITSSDIRQSLGVAGGSASCSELAPAGLLGKGPGPSNSYVRTANPNTGNFLTARSPINESQIATGRDVVTWVPPWWCCNVRQQLANHAPLAPARKHECKNSPAVNVWS